MRHTRCVSSLRALSLIAAAAILSYPAPVSAGARITIVNNDGPGEGFNDPTPVAPVAAMPARRAASNG